jgi:hypothetical protein
MAWRNMRQRLSNLVFNVGNLVHISSSHMYNAVNQGFLKVCASECGVYQMWEHCLVHSGNRAVSAHDTDWI